MQELSSADTNDRTFNVVFTTGATVRRYNFWADESYDEELVADPATVRMGRLNSGAPVLDTHGQYALSDVIGVVVPGSARVENGVGRATLKIDGGDENESIVRKIKDGIIRNVSVGYRVHQYEVIQRDGEVPLYRAVDWEPHEISLVPIGADAGAGIRSAPHTYPCEIFQPHLQPNVKENTMPDTVIDKDPPANAAVAASAATATRAADNPKPENPDPAASLQLPQLPLPPILLIRLATLQRMARAPMACRLNAAACWKSRKLCVPQASLMPTRCA